jgi:hypothetical protein
MIQERERIFYSSRDFSRYPRLVVNYSIQQDNQPPQVSVEPLPQWSQSRFAVRWGGHDPGGSGIANYDVQYRLANGSWIPWLTGVTGTSADFVGSEPNKYEFRARGTDRAGNVQPWSSNPQASTTVDTTPPNAYVKQLPTFIFQEPFRIEWTGTDNLSQIKCYDIQYREAGGSWVQAFTCTTDEFVDVTGAEDGVTYELRARATDNAGNVQPWPEAQTQTTISTSGPQAWILPFPGWSGKTVDPNITVQWTGNSSAGATIVGYDLQYRYGLGPWTPWPPQRSPSQTSDTFVGSQDGQYCFEARAIDSIGRVEPFDNVPEACIVLDQDGNVLPKSYLPFMP